MLIKWRSSCRVSVLSKVSRDMDNPHVCVTFVLDNRHGPVGTSQSSVCLMPQRDISQREGGRKTLLHKEGNKQAEERGSSSSSPSGSPSKVNCKSLTWSHGVLNVKTRPKCSEFTPRERSIQLTVA